MTFGLFINVVVVFFQDEPFTSNEPETIFNMAKFLLHNLMSDVPNGISKVYPLCIDFWIREIILLLLLLFLLLCVTMLKKP